MNVIARLGFEIANDNVAKITFKKGLLNAIFKWPISIEVKNNDWEIFTCFLKVFLHFYCNHSCFVFKPCETICRFLTKIFDHLGEEKSVVCRNNSVNRTFKEREFFFLYENWSRTLKKLFFHYIYKGHFIKAK